jgi:pimeloyl-ACP methyl ester carboxylesterase
MRPEVRYASADGHAVAYKVMGDGGPLVLVSNWITNVDSPDSLMDRYIRGLATFSQTAFFDQLGTGQSDPLSDTKRADPQTWVASISAVMDAVGWRAAALIGYDHASLAMLAFAAGHPERVERLVMINPVICYQGGDGYPSLLPDVPVSEVVDFMMSLWATPRYLPFFCPSSADQEELCGCWQIRLKAHCVSSCHLRTLSRSSRPISVLCSPQFPSFLPGVALQPRPDVS